MRKGTSTAPNHSTALTWTKIAVVLVRGSEPSVVMYRKPPGVAEEICTHMKLFVVHVPEGLLHIGGAAVTAQVAGTITGGSLGRGRSAEWTRGQGGCFPPEERTCTAPRCPTRCAQGGR